MLLQVEGLHAHYGKSHVIQGVSLTVGAGETVALLGRNGVGKSTTMKALIGLLTPSAGSVRLGGREVAGEPAHRVARLGLGYVPEERRIFPDISVLDNLRLGLKAPPQGRNARWTIETILDHFPHLRERCRQIAGTLSGGEQQMLTLGRTLLGNPDVVLVDEPTEGLAPVIVEQVQRLLRRMQEAGLGVLLVEQSFDFVRDMASRAYVMGKGRMVFEGALADLERASDIRKSYLEVGNG